jgi:hypothetical protein
MRFKKGHVLLDTLLTSSTQINFLTASAVPRNHPAASPGICVAANTYLFVRKKEAQSTCDVVGKDIRTKIVRKHKYSVSRT